MVLLEKRLPEPVYVALMTSSSGGIGAKLAGFFILPAQAALAAYSVSAPLIGAAALFTLFWALPRSTILFLWNRRRHGVTDSASVRQWELLLSIAALPYSLGVGFIVLTTLLHGDSTWLMVETAVMIGYCSVFPVSVGMRPSVGTTHLILAMTPGIAGCLYVGTVPHYVMAGMAVLLVQVLRENMKLVYRAFVDRIQLQLAADKRADRDRLTGAASRLAFEERVAILQKGAAPFALMLLDLDDLKGADEELGHTKGDRLLALLSERIRASLLEHEFFGRLGYGRFGILTTPDRAELLVDTLMLIGRIPLQLDGHVVRLALSVGTANGPADDLRDLAIGALKAAKATSETFWRPTQADHLAA